MKKRIVPTLREKFDKILKKETKTYGEDGLRRTILKLGYIIYKKEDLLDHPNGIVRDLFTKDEIIEESLSSEKIED
jgi:hypothetical protein